MTDLNPEGLEKAAEEVADEMPSCAVCEKRDTRRCQYCRREAERYARAAVAAYLGHTEVTTVEELRALPGRSAVLDADGMVAQMGANGPDHWDGFGRCWDADQITLPATVIHRGGGQ